MKIAFVALPNQDSAPITPPLPIGYLAALLEQQRHIVRIYDLALHSNVPAVDALAPLRAFRPHIVVIGSAGAAERAQIEAALVGLPAAVMQLGMHQRDVTPGQAVAQALWSAAPPAEPVDEQSVIYEALLGLDHDLDALPFPARHLLALEQYPLFTPSGDLQTPVLTGQQFDSDSCIPRSPAQIVAEVRSVAREYGIRHFLFAGPLLNASPSWLHDLLYHLATADLGVSWEGCVQYDQLSGEQLRMLRRAGCEVLCFPLDAVEVLGAKNARAELSHVIEPAHELGVAVRAQIQLNPSYAAMPMLVDVAATFGFDDVRFNVPGKRSAAPQAPGAELALDNITEMVQSRYRTSLSRQFFVERFGPRMGPMLWRVGRAGLLGRTWQRYADGADEGRPLPRGASA